MLCNCEKTTTENIRYNKMTILLILNVFVQSICAQNPFVLIPAIHHFEEEIFGTGNFRESDEVRIIS